jgi:hypothetical protein
MNCCDNDGNGVFCGSTPMLYNEEARPDEIQNGKNGIKLCKEDFMCAAVTVRLIYG